MSVMADKEFSSPSSRRRTTTKKLSKLPKLLSSSNKKSPNNTTTLPVNSFSRGDAVEDTAVSGFPSKNIALSRSNSNATKIPTHKSFVKSSKVVVTSIPPESQQPHPLLNSKMDTSVSGSASTSDRDNLAVSTEQLVPTHDEALIPQSAPKTENLLELEQLPEPSSNTKNADADTNNNNTAPKTGLPEPEIIPSPVTVTVTVTTVTKAEEGSPKTLNKQRKSLLPKPKRTKPETTPVHGATLITRSRTISHANPNNSSSLNNSRLLTPPECKIQNMPSKSGIPNASEIPLISPSKIRILSGSTTTARKIPTLIPSSKKLNVERANTSLGNLENHNTNKDEDHRNFKINSVSSLPDRKSKLPRLSKPKSDKGISKTTTTSSAQKLPSQNMQSLIRKKSMHNTNNLLHPSMKTNPGGGAKSSKSNNKDKCGGEAEAKFSYSQRFKQLQINSAKTRGKTVSSKDSQNAEIELKRESKTSTLSTLPLQKTHCKPKQSNSADKIGSTKVTPNLLTRDEDVTDCTPIKVKYTPSKESTFTVKTPGTGTGTGTAGAGKRTSKGEKKKDKSGGTIIGIFETPSPLLLDTSESDSDFNKGKSKSELEIKKSFSLKEIWPKLDGRKSSSGKDGLNGVESPSFNESFSDFEFLELPMKGFGFKSKTKRSSSVLHPADAQIEANLSSNNSHCGTTALSPCESDLQKLQTLVVVESPQLLNNNENGKVASRSKSKGTIAKIGSTDDKATIIVTAEKELLKSAFLNLAETIPAIPEPFIGNQKGSLSKVTPEPGPEMKTPASASGSNHLIQFSSEEALDIKRRLQCPRPKAVLNNSNKDLLEEGTEVCSTSRHVEGNQQVAPLLKLLTVPVPASMNKNGVVLLEAGIHESKLKSNVPLDDIHAEMDNEKVTPVKSIASALLINTETNNPTKPLPVRDPAPALFENSAKVYVKKESNSSVQVQQTSKPTSTLTKINSPRSRTNSSIPTSTRSRGGKSEKSNLKRDTDTDNKTNKGEPEIEIKPGHKTGEVSSKMPTKVVASEIAVPSLDVKKSVEMFSTNTSSNLSKNIHSSLSIPTGDSSSTSSCDSFKSAQTPETTSTCSLSLRMSQTMPLTLSSVSLKVAKLLSQNALTSGSASGSGTALIIPSLTQTQSTPKIIENTNSSTQQIVQLPQFQASSKHAVATNSETSPLGSATATAATSILTLKQKSKDSTKIPKKLKSIEIQSKTAVELPSSSSSLQTDLNLSSTIMSTLSGKVSATPYSHSSMISTPKVKVHEVQVTDPSRLTAESVLAKLPTSCAATSLPRLPSSIDTGELRGQGQNCVDQIPVVVSAKIPSESSKIDPHKSSCTFLKAPKSVKSSEKLGKEHPANLNAHKELVVSETEMSNTADKLKFMEGTTKPQEVLIVAPPSPPTLIPHSNNDLNPSRNNSSLPVEIKSLRKRKMSSENSFPLTPNNTPNSSNFNSATSTIATECECTLSAVEVQQRIFEDDEEKALLPQIESVGSLHSACMSCRIESLNSIISTTTHSNTNCSSPFRGCDQKTLVSRISETMDETLIEEIRAARRQSIQQFELKQQLARHVMIDQAVSMYSVGSHLEGFLRIQNKSSLSICYRVTSLVAGRYQIIPFSGKLEPMETVSITVASSHPSKFLKREANQFKVEAALGPLDVVTPSEQRLFWKEISRHQIYETSVEVVRILHPNHPTFDDNDESGSNDVPSGDGIVRRPAKQLKSEVIKTSLPTTTASIGLYTVALGLVAAALHQCSSALDQF